MIRVARWLRDWIGAESVLSMLRQERLATAEAIARAIRESTPAAHLACTSWPHCTRCGRAAQADEDARTAFRTAAGR